MSKDVSTGIEDFKKIINSDYYFVDKTLFIKNVIDNADDVCLITRPRRFGKTLNLSMLKYYFDIKEDSKELFKGLKIMDAGYKYTNQMNKYPVIFLSLRGLKRDTYEGNVSLLKNDISTLYEKYRFLLESDKISDAEKVKINKFLYEDVTDDELAVSLLNLSEYLSKHYGVKVLMLLDEYDNPLENAYVKGFYNQAISFWQTFFEKTFKSNDNIYKTILTGVNRVAKESIFSGLNNFKPSSVLNDIYYNDDFGFNEQEVNELLEYYNMLEYRDVVKKWYDGYKIGNVSNIYNPWSILNFLQNKKIMPYWVNTSGNVLIKDLLKNSQDLKIKFEKLLSGDTILVSVSDTISFVDIGIDDEDDNVWSLLISAGYLKVVENFDLSTAYVDIPNEEIRFLFKDIIKSFFGKKVGDKNFEHILNYLIDLNYNDFIDYFKKLVYDTFSTWDVTKDKSENFYHAFVLGMLVSLEDKYFITSNRESGLGRYDILMKPKEKRMPSFIIEFKVVNDGNFEVAKELGKKQIIDRKYETLLKQEGYENIQKLVFAFQGKNVEIEVF